MTDPVPCRDRVRVDGKFFRLGESRFRVRGVTYGSFGPNKAGDPFPEPARVVQDLELVRRLGANVLRIYHLPPPWLMDLCAEQGLRLMVGIPWASHSCFLDSRGSRREARTAVITAIRRLAGHPSIFAVTLANEIPADLLRWSGASRVGSFLDELVFAAHEIDPHCLCTYASFPTTEFLQPRHLDFVTFNVFLHEARALADYLARLQSIAEGKPLLLGECGADSRREGLPRQAEIVSHNLATASQAGLAGAIVFGFTDDWVREGRRIDDWEMGLTTVDRQPKPAYDAVRERFADPPPSPSILPRVSVVVASYNAAHTLRDCLNSLLHLDYPDYEIIVVDDGSTDDTTRITADFPQIRTLRHPVNMGLSCARNLGIRAATGDLIAFTDADCRADPEWLRFLVIGILELRAAGIGGPNLLPPDDSPVAAAVMASPGGPSHVMLDDRYAEHLPGCNMAFWRWALEGIGNFDPVFHRAGDDVDVCWRILRQGWRLGFAPSAIVWHHRRSSIRGYLRQQAGYGEAEALLVTKHPERFNAIGGAQWQGRIAGNGQHALPWNRPVIYRGVFATAMFQTLYTPAADGLLPLVTSLEYHVVVAIPLVLFTFSAPWLWPLALAAFLIPPLFCATVATRVVIPRDRRRWWSRPLVAVLHHLQPLVRSAARYRVRLELRTEEPVATDQLAATALDYSETSASELAFWSAQWRDRSEWIAQIVDALRNHCWPFREDAGWSDFDLEVFGSRWSSIALATVAEVNHDGSQTLRARLRRRWTLTAQVLFWGTLAGVILIAGLFQVNWRGAWIPVATQLLIAWFLQRQGRALQCRLAVLLDHVARDWKLVTLRASDRQRRPAENPPDPASPPA